MLTIDLPFIAQEAVLKEEENIAFRTFLKNLDMTSGELDSIVHAINAEVTAQIDCTQCANCCKITDTLLSEKDIARFAKGLKTSPSDFQTLHVVPYEQEAGKFTFDRLPCPFLAGDLCTNYEARPEECHSFPHLHKKHFRGRLFGVINNYAICPIVYHVVEQLKELLWTDDFLVGNDLFDDPW